MLKIWQRRAKVTRGKIARELDDIKINQGRILCELHACKPAAPLNAYEFKVFSQWGEDGIIQFLVANLRIKNRTFIEFGVEDFSESNCRFLMMKDNWKGFVLDGSPRQIERLQAAYFYWRHTLRSKAAFFTRDNANALLEESGFDKEVGLLSVDLDGVDYHVLQALGAWQPSVLIVEYNAVFGCERAVSVPYDPSFHRTAKHTSNLYFGASLPAFMHLANTRGYAFVGANNAGNNAFFVRRELLNDMVRETTLAEGFRESRFREAKDAKKRFTFSEGPARRQVIAQMPLIDVISGEALRVGDLQG